MNPHDMHCHSPDDYRRIDCEAAGWLVRQDLGFTPEDQDAFFQWLAADPRHGEWFSRHRQTWNEFNRLAEWKPEHSTEPNPDLLARPRTETPILRWARFGGLAAAAGFAVAVLWKQPWSRPTLEAAPTVLIAKGYERRVLEDGSVVELNDGARIEVAYSTGERRVRLEQGEASFTVAKNPDRPFVVRAVGVDVRAVGTVFNVRLGEGAVHVLVTEGRVRVDDAVWGTSVLAQTTAGDTPMLAANEQVTIPLGPPAPVPVVAVTGEDIARQLAWLPELLEFNATPLGEVVAAFNKRNRIQLTVEDEALLQMPIVASFRSDNVEGFVRLLELTAGMKADRTGDTIALHAAR